MNVYLLYIFSISAVQFFSIIIVIINQERIFKKINDIEKNILRKIDKHFEL